MPAPITITDPFENTQEECDIVLGGFLRAWDQMQISIVSLMEVLLATHLKAAYILIHSGIDHPTLRTAFESAGKLRLTETDQRKLERFLRRWKDASAKRNKIVHGVWQLQVEITDVRNEAGIKRTKARWTRYYAPADMNKIDPVKARKNQKLRAAHYFELSTIVDATGHVRKLAHEINAFVKDLKLRPFEDAIPVEFDQYGNAPPQSK